MRIIIMVLRLLLHRLILIRLLISLEGRRDMEGRVGMGIRVLLLLLVMGWEVLRLEEEEGVVVVREEVRSLVVDIIS